MAGAGGIGWVTQMVRHSRVPHSIPCQRFLPHLRGTVWAAALNAHENHFVSWTLVIVGTSPAVARCERLRKSSTAPTVTQWVVPDGSDLTCLQPYARRYHGPDSPYFDAPLFLDCCGLVRRVMDDLQEDFGFRLGRWNQVPPPGCRAPHV